MPITWSRWVIRRADAPCASACGSDSEVKDETGRNPRAAISWSGGKDSCAALHRTHAHYDIVTMGTMCDETAARSRSHGLRPEVLDAQAERLALSRVSRGCTWPTYNAAFADALAELARDGIT